MATHRRRRLSAIAALLAAVLVVTTACTDEPDPAPNQGPTPVAKALTFGVFGSSGEVAAYQSMANSFDGDVRVMAWKDADEATRAFRSGMDLPDVFLVPRRSLGWFLDRDLTQPVDELLDERGVNFGDDYNRDAVRAFASDGALQCMPFAVSPMVIYYNRDLIDFDRMRERDLDAPDTASKWTFSQFEEAAAFATRPRRGTRGVWIDPTIPGMAPFVLSGGGQLFDDASEPTSLAFSSEETQTALSTTLELLRNAQVTPTDKQLAHRTPLELFEAGKLGMIAGFRNLTPQLRQVGTLNFDVMPMPTLDSAATIGDFVGLCMSSDSVNPSAAADFVVHTLSESAVSRVTRAGYLVPANVKVAASDDFLQPGQQPLQSQVFTDSIRNIEGMPLLDSWSRLQDAVGPSLRQLITDPVLDLPALGEEIDSQSRTVLDPEQASPTTSPSPTDESSD